jgi:DNA-binding NtrC family response regulator
MQNLIMFVDDETGILNFVEKAIQNIGLESICFTDPNLAKNYLEMNKEPCMAYFVDMRIPSNLQGSEELFNYINQNGLNPEDFFFMTGHFSDHDEKVILRTQRPYLLKPFGIKDIEKVLKISNYS